MYKNKEMSFVKTGDFVFMVRHNGNEVDWFEVPASILRQLLLSTHTNISDFVEPHRQIEIVVKQIGSKTWLHFDAVSDVASAYFSICLSKKVKAALLAEVESNFVGGPRF